MRIKDVFRLVGGACVVYVAMAACSGRGDSDEALRLPSRPIADAAPSTTGSSSSGVVGAIVDAARELLDAMVDPVHDAAAAAPTIVTSACDKVLVQGSGDATYYVYYAEASFPARSVAELSTVHAAMTGAPVAGYTHSVRDIWVKAGGVAAPCDVGSQVTFVLPP